MALLAIPSPSGYTYQVNGYVSEQLDLLGASHTTTTKGAIVATVPGRDRENQRTISAHVDTPAPWSRKSRATACSS